MLVIDHVQTDANDQQTAHGAHLVDDGIGEQRRDPCGQQSDCTLIDKHRSCRKCHACSHGAGEEDGGYAVQRGLGDKRCVIASQTAIHRTDNRHGADTVHQRSGDEGIGEASGAAQLPLGEFAQIIQAAFDVHSAACKTADHDGHDHAHGVRCLQRTGCTDQQHAQPQSLHDRLAEAIGDAFAQQQTQRSAGKNGDNVNQGSDHGKTLFLLSNRKSACPSNEGLDRRVCARGKITALQ